jgi:hypothetical protein
MGQLLRNGVDELYAAAEATTAARIAAYEAELEAIKAKMAAELDAIAALEIEMADTIREREWWQELKARAADAEDPDAVNDAAIREREALLEAAPCSEPGEDPGDAGPAKNADKKPADFGEK